MADDQLKQGAARTGVQRAIETQVSAVVARLIPEIERQARARAEDAMRQASQEIDRRTEEARRLVAEVREQVSWVEREIAGLASLGEGDGEGDGEALALPAPQEDPPAGYYPRLPEANDNDLAEMVRRGQEQRAIEQLRTAVGALYGLAAYHVNRFERLEGALRAFAGSPGDGAPADPALALEILSRDPGDSVSFDEGWRQIVQRINEQDD